MVPVVIVYYYIVEQLHKIYLVPQVVFKLNGPMGGGNLLITLIHLSFG
jgi:hypothetical protein